ncbi:hypothetical protein ACFXGI_35025 [Streptomyces sp. NPDC059355]|uniref:hypothetical protein n=1 Tax=Streptomyces sp. NPDC059355 TaxID=3346811 RepID=UPI00369A2EE9
MGAGAQDYLVRGKVEACGRLGIEGFLPLINTTPSQDPAAHLDSLIRQTRALNAGRHTDDPSVLRLDWGFHQV